MDLANIIALIGIGVAIFFGLAGLVVTGRVPSLTPPWVRRIEEDGDRALEDAPPERAPTPVFSAGRPASLSEGFYGRDVELAEISEAFKDHRVVVISGSAGAGKSRLAAEYAHASGLSGYWTDAAETTTQTLVALAPEFDVEIGSRSDDEIADDVRRHLEQAEASTLWVIDNLANLGHLNELMNAVSVMRLLVTTRDARRNLLPHTVSFHPLEVLEQDAAISLLCSRSEDCDPDDEATGEIADAVGCLPLALEMLAVRLGEPLQSPDKLLAEIRQAPTPVQIAAFKKAVGATIGRAEGVYATIASTLAVLPSDVREQIAPLGYVEDSPIPHALAAALVGLDDETLGEFLDRCSRQSLVTTREGSAVIHGLTVAAIAAMNSEDAIKTALSRARGRLSAINEDDPIALRAELSHHDRLCSEAISHVGWRDEGVLLYAISLGVAYHLLGRYEDWILIDERALEQAERHFGSEHRHTLGLRNNLANAYLDAGRAQDAIRLHEETLSARERVLGPDHPDTLSSRNNLANAYQDAGRAQDAIPLYEETLSAREQVLGPDHPHTLSSRNNLANAYQDAGRAQDAIPIHEETLLARVRVLGPDHPDTLRSRNNLANVYRTAGRAEEAIALHEETLAAMETILGGEHPDTLRSRYNIANAYLDAGRAQDAIPLYEETLAAMKRLLGPAHPSTVNSRNNLAIAYRAARRDADAERLEAEGDGATEGDGD